MDFGKVIAVIPGGVLNLFGGILLSQLSGLIRLDHPSEMNYAVEVDGIWDAGFRKADGLSDRATPFESNSINLQASDKIYPYKRQAGLVTLEKGLTFRGLMEEWYYDMINFQKGGKSPLKNVSFIQLQRIPPTVPFLGNQLIEVKRWIYPMCICRDLTGPKFDAMKESGISILKSVVDCTKPNRIQGPTNFGFLGHLLDALVK